MHVFPGTNNFAGDFQEFWHDNATADFLEIVNKYRDKITLLAGAHVHRQEHRMQVSKEYPDLKLPLLITPSVSPVYLNNPAYTIVKMNSEQVEEVFVRSYQLQNMIYGLQRGLWHDLSPKKEF